MGEGRLYFMYSSPLDQDQLDVRSELQLLQTALQSGRQGLTERKPFEVKIDVRLGRADHLLDLLTHGDAACPGSPIFLHLAMHAGATADGPGTDRLRSFILLEDHVGFQHRVYRDELLRWLSKGADRRSSVGSCASEPEGCCRVSAVFVNSCDSQGIATAFMEAGVPHVICCNGQIFDGACKIFTRGFYRSLGMGRSIHASFEHAREAVACSPQVGLRAEASKFQLLPRQEDLFYYPVSLSSVQKHHHDDLCMLTTVKRNDRVASPDELESPRSNAPRAMRLMGVGEFGATATHRQPPRTQHFLGRVKEMIQMAEHLAQRDERLIRVVNVWSNHEGVGKTALLAQFTRFFFCPGRLFDGAAIWAPLQPAALAEQPPLSAMARTSSGGLEGRGEMFLSQVARAVKVFINAYADSLPEHSPRSRRSSKSSLPGSKVRDELLGLLQNLERAGCSRVLLVLDGIEDWVDSAEVRAAIADMLQSTERLCLVFGSRIHVQNSFAGLKTDNLELKPLCPRDAAQLFLYRVHRALQWKDLWRTKEEWMANVRKWYGDDAFSKVADRALLDSGEVPITLERGRKSEILDALGAMPLLSEFCQGVPLLVQQVAEQVTAELGSLWELLDRLRAKRDAGRMEIRQRLMATAESPEPPVEGAVKERSKFWRSKFWQLGKVIGQGAYGIVHHGFDSASGDSFAVKVLEESPGILQELELYQTLDHPHIVRYYGHEVQEKQVYIFLEYMPEGSLKDKLTEYGQFQEDLCCKVAREILRGLEYLHGNNVLHRDLKCSNLLLDSANRVKIADFGCSRWVGSQDNAKTFVGSPWWLPPELLGGEPYNHSADIWSFGCSVVELLTGRSPWAEQINADHPLAAAHQILLRTNKGVLPGPGPDCTKFSDACREFVWSSCLAITPAERLGAPQLLAHAWLASGSPKG